MLNRVSMVLLIAVGLSLALSAGCSDTAGCSVAKTEREQQMAKPAGKVLRHVVLFKFKDEATPEQVKTVVDAFRALPSKIDTIKGFEWGTDVSPEKRAQGFTHLFFLTFADEAGRDAYLPHPAHKEFGATLRPYLDKVLVVDYIAQE